MFEATTTTVASSVDEESYRRTLSRFASGVTVITTLDAAGDVHGMTATAFSSLSLRPPLVLIAVSRGSRCHRQLIAGKQFGVSILEADQVALSKHFGGKPSSDVAPRYAKLGGAHVLESAIAALACRIEEAPLAGGDHSIFIGLVTDIMVRGGEPLIHYGGTYRTLSA
jgi:flavin reductase (DIM6/NTAB) family NADH-FMN oxidoreductase RutF